MFGKIKTIRDSFYLRNVEKNMQSSVSNFLPDPTYHSVGRIRRSGDIMVLSRVKASVALAHYRLVKMPSNLLNIYKIY